MLEKQPDRPVWLLLRLTLAGAPGNYPFRLAASRQATFPKGTAFGGGGKVSGIAQRRPLGGTGCERSEQTEGVPAARLFPQETSAAVAVSLHDPTRENAFGALRRARQTRIIKYSFR